MDVCGVGDGVRGWVDWPFYVICAWDDAVKTWFLKLKCAIVSVQQASIIRFSIIEIVVFNII